MKIKLAKDRQIKGTMRKAGESVIVRKDVGERLINQGLAERVIEQPQNRVIAPAENRIRGVPGAVRFTEFERFGR